VRSGFTETVVAATSTVMSDRELFAAVAEAAVETVRARRWLRNGAFVLISFVLAGADCAAGPSSPPPA
jgi:hypothetical protein